MSSPVKCLPAFEEQSANMWHYDPVDTEHTGHCPPRQRRAPRDEADEGQHESAYPRTLPSRESRPGTWGTASLSAQTSTHDLLQFNRHCMFRNVSEFAASLSRSRGVEESRRGKLSRT